MTIVVRAFISEDANIWDDFCLTSLQSTLLHTRHFLSYHELRFVDKSLIIEEDGKLIGLFPAAKSLDDDKCIVSHPGITYGGVVHQGRLRGNLMLHALKAVASHYAKNGYSKLIYKAVPTIYHRAPAQDDLYALFILGANRIRCDISSTIDLQNRLPITQRRRRNLKKACKAGLFAAEGNQYLKDFWSILVANLASKHETVPVHTLNEIELLAERFPKNIHCICGMRGGVVLGGVLLFVTPTTWHAQYISSNIMGRDLAVLDLVFEHCINAALNYGKRWFDFGISTTNSGRILNDGLYNFKSEFGAGGTVHEFYELDLI